MLMKKKSCPLIKVNKKNTLLKENNNKVSYVSEAIKKKKRFIYILHEITILGGIQQNELEFKMKWNKIVFHIG